MTVLRQILPVIDIKKGQVVHGVAGQRERYAPIQSRIVDSVLPHEVAASMCDVVGTREVYVADLDAISGRDEPNWSEYKAIRQRDLSVWLDAGLVDESTVNEFLNEHVDSRIIFGLESLPTLRTLEHLLKKTPGNRIVFSLDMKAGIPITVDPMAQRLSPETIAAFAVDAGIRSMIVLDLAAVGTGSGLRTLELCTKIRSRYEQLELVSGGGVRNIDDVRRYLEAGCDRVLVATALHSGGIESDDF